MSKVRKKFKSNYKPKENEKWIKGLEHRYFVNTLGEIWSTVREKPLKVAGAVIFDSKRNTSKYRVFLACYLDGVKETLYFHPSIRKQLIILMVISRIILLKTLNGLHIKRMLSMLLRTLTGKVIKFLLI
jgi:hypothetical protein